MRSACFALNMVWGAVQVCQTPSAWQGAGGRMHAVPAAANTRFDSSQRALDFRLSLVYFLALCMYLKSYRFKGSSDGLVI